MCARMLPEIMIRMTADEYKKMLSVRSPRKDSPLRSDDTTANVCKSAVSAVHNLQSFGFGCIFDGNVRVTVEIHGNTKADSDNCLKGILDALEGFAYRNDKQVKEATVRICSCND